jgi:hypothetical protein
MSGHPILARATEENIKQWKFDAPCSSGQPEARTIEFTYDFRLDGDATAGAATRFRYEHPFRVIAISKALYFNPSLEKNSR